MTGLVDLIFRIFRFVGVYYSWNYGDEFTLNECVRNVVGSITLTRGGGYKTHQVAWFSPIHGPKATAFKGPLCEVEVRA